MASPNSPTTLRRNLSQACKKGDAKTVSAVLEQLGRSPNVDNHAAFINALQCKHLECAALVFPVCVTDKAFTSKALQVAIEIKNPAWVQQLLEACPTPCIDPLLALACDASAEIVAQLLPYTNASYNNCLAMSRAVTINSPACVRVLLPVLPIDQYDRMLDKAALRGHSVLIPLFLPHTTTYGRARALARACQNNDVETFNMLYPVTQIDKAVEVMDQWNTKYHVAYSDRQLLSTRLQDEQEKQKLNKMVASVVRQKDGEPPTKRKM